MKVRIILLLVLLSGLQACDRGIPKQAQGTVSGEVTYLQRVALSNEAVLTVILEDVTEIDDSSTALAEQRVALGGRQVPLAFKLQYDRRKLKEDHRYAVSARIEDGRGLLFTTTELFGVSLAEPEVEVTITVDAVAAVVGVEGRGPAFSCRGNKPYWSLTVAEHSLDLKRKSEDAVTNKFNGAYTALFGPDGGAFYEWIGLAGQAGRLKLRVLPGQCLDKFAAEEELEELDYSARIDIKGETLKGCCQMISHVKANPVIIYECENDTEIATVYVAEGNSSQLLLQLEDGRELVLAEQSSAFGSKFSDGGTLFWIKSDDAILELEGADAVKCSPDN